MRTYLGLFVLSAATLALEIALTRLLSVVSWYHLAFFAIATAMLGATAGAVTVYLRPQRYAGDRLLRHVQRAAQYFGASVLVPLVVLCVMPLTMYPSLMSGLGLLLATSATSLPYYFSGVAIGALLTRGKLPIGRMYAADLLGAATGCLVALGALSIVDAPSLIILCGALGLLAAMIFGGNAPGTIPRKQVGLAALVLLALAAANASTRYGIRPIMVKGKLLTPGDYVAERWNSISRVVVLRESEVEPPYWGPSPLAPKTPTRFYSMNIDGDAATTVLRAGKPEDVEFLKFDVTNIVHALRPRGPQCVIGVGGGRDIWSGLVFGHEQVTGIEVNPIFIELLNVEFRNYTRLAGRPDVRFHVDEARSYLSRSNESFDVVQMSLIDTWAATGAGAFSFSENGLYTVSGWKIFLSRLTPNGIFTVSRWYDPGNLGETGRVVSLAMATLMELGVAEPARHVALIGSGKIATLLLAREPFSDADIATLRWAVERLQFTPLVVPGEPVAHPLVAGLLAARDRSALDAIAALSPLNYVPPTDDNPYFFNMLTLRSIGTAISAQAGSIWGNLVASLTLAVLIVVLCIVATVTILLPLWLARRDGATAAGLFWPAAAYFALIGAGFMMTEIALVQYLSVFLGHPVYALGVLLFTIILGTGIGSLLSERLPLTRWPGLMLYPLAIAAAIFSLRHLLPPLMAANVSTPMGGKIVMAIAVVFPVGMMLGVCFPTGMRLVERDHGAETAWYWALNGVFGVLCSAIAVFVSIYFGISTTMVAGATCYLSLLLCLPRMAKTGTAIELVPIAASVMPLPTGDNLGQNGSEDGRRARPT